MSLLVYAHTSEVEENTRTLFAFIAVEMIIAT